MPNDPDDWRKYLPPTETVEPRVGVTPASLPPPVQKLASGMTPMENVKLDGQIARGLTSGRIAWWVLITGWLILGGMGALMLYIAISTGVSFWSILPAAIGAIMIWLMVRGTLSKLEQQKRKPH